MSDASHVYVGTGSFPKAMIHYIKQDIKQAVRLVKLGIMIVLMLCSGALFLLVLYGGYAWHERKRQ